MGLNTTILVDQSVDDNLTNAFNAGEGILGKFTTPATLLSTAITFTYALTQGGTYVELRDKNNAQVSVTVTTSKAYDFPPECLGVGWLKFALNDNEVADRIFEIQLGP